jgi:hypothetical protein
MYDTLLECARIAEDSGISMNLEALNVITDHVGNFLRTTRTAAEMTRLIGSPRLKILYDVYHMQLNEGNLCNNIREFIDQIGHIHVADAPGRHEPGTGEINYHRIFAVLEDLGYQGRIVSNYTTDYDSRGGAGDPDILTGGFPACREKSGSINFSSGRQARMGGSVPVCFSHSDGICTTRNGLSDRTLPGYTGSAPIGSHSGKAVAAIMRIPPR